MRGNLVGPRVLLRRLREVMAEPIGAQARLDKIVTLIAANMVAEVCSVYVLRADGILELFATEGLNRSAVHKTILRVSEGLVGQIAQSAEPLNLPDARAHPAFAYRPETGEEIYHSFLGVPVLRAGRTLGVLVVQNRARKTYSEEEEEALQTVAMVIAEMVASGELHHVGSTPTPLDLARPMQLAGTVLSEGIGLGYVVLHEPRVVVTNLIAEDTERELARLREAIAKLRLSVDDMLQRGEVAHHGEHRDVLEAYRMFAYDRGWVRRMEEAVLRSGLTAEGAVERVQSDTRARMMRQTDPYLRERLHDFDDLTFRLLRELVGKPKADHGALPVRDAIIVARNMGAAELLDYDRERVRGLVLEEGGPTSHVTIIARALGIAAVGQVADAVTHAETGDAIIVDGEAGRVQLRPPQDLQRAYGEKVRFRARRQARYRRLRNSPSVTRDGTRIDLYLNAGLMFDVPHLDETGAAGIGLFRTELQFLVADRLPNLGTQTAFYASVLEAAGERPVTFRTLDIGSDKVLPYFRPVEEENPAMGWRAVRIGLDRPALLRMQLRALLRGGAGRDVRIMFPFVTEVKEFDAAKALVDKELAHLRRHGREPPSSVKLGVMVEVPALLFQLDALFGRVDFASVGSNDLFQFLFAADRGSLAVTSRFDPLCTGFLRALKLIADKAAEYDVPLTLCGELAGRTTGALALIALGYRALSMSPAGIGPVKAMIRALDAGRLREEVLPLLDDDAADIPGRLAAFAEANGVPL